MRGGDRYFVLLCRIFRGAFGNWRAGFPGMLCRQPCAERGALLDLLSSLIDQFADAKRDLAIINEQNTHDSAIVHEGLRQEISNVRTLLEIHRYEHGC